MSCTTLGAEMRTAIDLRSIANETNAEETNAPTIRQTSDDMTVRPLNVICAREQHIEHLMSVCELASALRKRCVHLAALCNEGTATL